MSQTKRANTPHMRQVIAAFCRTAVEDYRRAGCPFGADVDGMLIWFEFGQHTTGN
ncbi:MAG: hypothetical protein KatS3mg043_1547 [Rhodothermaceae bacterium]|nr:MAG: hypothetical protein KatS3mg043_1547 [Rhodothermaceae bacterium]